MQNNLVLNTLFTKICSDFLAIHLCEDSVDDATLAVCLKNRAAVHLKEEDYESVVSDCTRYLEIKYTQVLELNKGIDDL